MMQKIVQLLTWNAGNLARRCVMDAVNNFLCQNWHLACVQEGNSDNVQQPLYDARGIASEKSECGSIVVNAGGGGYKSVEQTYDDTNPNRNWLPRYGKITDPFPIFNYDAILNQELDELIKRESSRHGKGGGEGIDPNLYEKEMERFQNKWHH